jgi:hypothetical protein
LKVKTNVRLLTALLVLCGGLAACPPHATIANINQDPGRYAGKGVTLAGRVSNSLGALGTGIFQLEDGTGSIWVYSQDFGVPSDGAKVAVTGRIEQGFNFGGRNIATVLRQTEPRH